jgi:RNA polymerase sigma-70 factor, ECF subfamily
MVEDFDAWYADARPPMAAALTVWCGDPALASDALDEAFVRAIERWERVRHLASPGGWVWSTATNVVRRRLRRHRIEARAFLRNAATERDAMTGPSGDHLDLHDALLKLPDRQRTAVVLHYIADLPTSEVAAVMEVAEGTVHATLHQARQRLGEHLARPAEPSTAPQDRTDGVVR